MDKILDLILKLVEKKPDSVIEIDEASLSIHYGDFQLDINDYDIPEYLLRIDSVVFTDKLSEKEYMQLRLKALEWMDDLKEDAIAKLKEFIDVPNGTMDDLLSD